MRSALAPLLIGSLLAISLTSCLEPNPLRPKDTGTSPPTHTMDCDNLPTLPECVGSTTRTQMIYQGLSIDANQDVVSLHVPFSESKDRMEVDMAAALVAADGTRYNFRERPHYPGSGLVRLDFGQAGPGIPPGSYDVILIWVGPNRNGWITFQAGTLRHCQ